MPLVNNYNGREWEGEKVAQVLARPAARANMVRQLLAYAQGQKFAGISVDFESVPERSHANLLRFMQELATAAHGVRLQVSLNVPVDDEAFDYRRLSDATDYMILMAYDQHWAGGDPGPIAALDWFSEQLAARAEDVPPAKTIVAIGNYAYDWQPRQEGEEKTFEEAILTAKESDA
jgi:spore germination protein YaaH